MKPSSLVAQRAQPGARSLALSHSPTPLNDRPNAVFSFIVVSAGNHAVESRT